MSSARRLSNFQAVSLSVGIDASLVWQSSAYHQPICPNSGPHSLLMRLHLIGGCVRVRVWHFDRVVTLSLTIASPTLKKKRSRPEE